MRRSKVLGEMMAFWAQLWGPAVTDKNNNRKWRIICLTLSCIETLEVDNCAIMIKVQNPTMPLDEAL
jgi:hypothetical protein